MNKYSPFRAAAIFLVGASVVLYVLSQLFPKEVSFDWHTFTFILIVSVSFLLGRIIYFFRNK
ncbi:hypothetical protein ACKP2L_01555 [Oenococcus alcoholitolerans]|uniref:hypothetical protein n=1 Tax=Oenococcus alcoholitolerans TaxID=931074 RepID=UPI003F6E965E